MPPPSFRSYLFDWHVFPTSTNVAGDETDRHLDFCMVLIIDDSLGIDVHNREIVSRRDFNAKNVRRCCGKKKKKKTRKSKKQKHEHVTASAARSQTVNEQQRIHKENKTTKTRLTSWLGEMRGPEVFTELAAYSDELRVEVRPVVEATEEDGHLGGHLVYRRGIVLERYVILRKATDGSRRKNPQSEFRPIFIRHHVEQHRDV